MQPLNATSDKSEGGAWSGQDADAGTAYASGTQAAYTIQTALTESTTYYWRSYAIDYAGSNSWSGTQDPVYSFVTVPELVIALALAGILFPTLSKQLWQRQRSGMRWQSKRYDLSSWPYERS